MFSWWSRHPHASEVVAVFAGGTLGSLARLALESLPAATGTWPWVTLLINLAGSLLLGMLTGWFARVGEDGWKRVARLGLGTGLIGGFTTYSTFALESWTRLVDGAAALSIGYAVLSVAAGLLTAAFGLWVGHLLAVRSEVRRSPGSDDSDGRRDLGVGDGNRS